MAALASRSSAKESKAFYLLDSSKLPVLSIFTLLSLPTVAKLSAIGWFGSGLETDISAVLWLGLESVTDFCTEPAGASAISSTSRVLSTSLRLDARVCSSMVAGP